MATVILVEATPWSAIDGNPTPVRLAGGGDRRGYNHRGFNDWRAGVGGVPRFTSLVGFGSDGWSGGAIPQTGAIGFQPSDAAVLSEIGGYVWPGAPIEIRTGDDALAEPAWTLELKGTVAGLTIKGGTIAFTVSDLSGALTDAFLTARFTGEGGIEGTSDAKDRTKRRSFGACFNVEGRLFDKANNIWEFGDPAFPLQDLAIIKDRGRAYSPVVTVAWQGSKAATLAALVAASVPGGGIAKAPSIALAKPWTTPAGPITADILGEIGPGYVDTVPAIAARVVTAKSALTISNVAEIAAVRGAVAGIHIDSDSETTAQLLDRLLFGASLLWTLEPAGTIRLAEITYADPLEDLDFIDVEREAAYKPISACVVGYQKNHRVQTDAEISAVFRAEDGTPIEDLISSAQGDATQALGDLEELADDGVLTVNEKLTKLIPLDAELDAKWSLLDGQAAAIAGFPLVTEARTTAAAARTAWIVFRNAMSPGWNNLSLSTAVSRTLYDGKLNDYRYAIDSLVDGLRRYAQTKSDWSGVSGAGRPADFATADLKLTPVVSSTYVTITGNSLYGNPSGSGYNSCVVGQALNGAVSVEADLVSGGYTLVALDDAATGSDYSEQTATVQVGPDGTWGLYVNGIGINSGTIAHATTKRLVLACDKVNIYVIIGGLLVQTYAAPTALKGTAAIFPKWWAYTPGTTQSGLRAGFWADQTQSAAAQADATSSLGKIENIQSDNVLARAEKSDLIASWANIEAEYPGLLARASAWSLSEGAAYTTAYSAAGSYLGTLSPAWNDTSVDTPFSGVTFRSKFTAYYSARQALVNAIDVKASQLAAWSGVTGTGRPSDYAGTTVTFYDNQNVFDKNGNTVLRKPGTGSGWNLVNAYTNEFSANTAFVSGTMDSNGVFMGLTSSQGVDSYTIIDYAFYQDGSNVSAFYRGNPLATLGAPDTSATYLMTYDGAYVRWYKNSTLLYTTAAPAGRTMYGVFNCYNAGYGVHNIQFGSYSQNTADVAPQPVVSANYVTVVGNTITGISSAAYQSCAVNTPQYGASFVEMDIRPGNAFTILALDATASGYDSTRTAMVFFNQDTGAVSLYLAGSEVYAATLGVGITGKVVLACDRVNLYVIVGGVLRKTYTAPTALKGTGAIYPKWYAYNTAYTYTGLRCGAWTSNSWSDVGGAGRPSDGATNDLVLTAVGAVSVVGNTIARTAGGAGYDALVMSKAPINGPQIAGTNVVESSSWTMVALDNDASTTDVAYSYMACALHFNYGTGNLNIYMAGSNVFNVYVGSVSGRLELRWDGKRYSALVAGVLRWQSAIRTVGNLWAKFHAYSADTTYTGLSHWADSPTASSNVTLYDVVAESYNNANWDIRGNSATFFKGAGWSGNVYSFEGYAGTAQITARFTDNSVSQMVGLTDSRDYTGTNDYAIGDFLIYNAAGNLYAYESGTGLALSASFTGTTTVMITYDGVNVRYYVDGVLKRTVATTANRTFYACLSNASVGSTISDIQFGAFSQNDWGAIGGSGRPEDNADVTLTSQFTIDMASAIDVAFEYTGTTASGLPKSLAVVVTRGGANVTTSNNASYALSNFTGGCTGSNVTVDNGAGSSTKGRPTILAGSAAPGSFDWTLTYNGVVVATRTVKVTKNLAQAPAGSGSGSSGYTKSGTFDAGGQGVGSTSFSTFGQVNNINVAAGESLYGNFYSLYHASGGGNFVSRTMSGKFQRSPAGANSWTDFGAAVTGSTASFNNLNYDDNPGDITINQSTSPGAGNYDVRLVLAESSAINSAVLSMESPSPGSVIAKA